MPAAFVQRAGSASATGATLTLTVGKDSGVSIGGFATLPIGHTAVLCVEAPGAVYVTGVTDSHGATNTWTVNSTGGGSTSGVRTGLVSCRLAAALASGDTITITWSATPGSAASGNLIDLSGVGAASGVAAVDPHGIATLHSTSVTPDVTLPNPLTVSGCIAISVCASSSSTGTNAITTADATSGGTWTDLGYPVQPAKMDIAYQVVSGTTEVEAAWANSAGPPQNTDVLIVAFQPASSLSVSGTPPEVTAGDHLTFVPTITGGTSPYTLALNTGSGPIPPGLTLVPGGGGTVTPGQFGCTYHVPSLGTIPQATKIWEGTPAGQPSMVNRIATFRKCFFGTSDGTGSISSFPKTFSTADLQGAFDLDMTAFLVYKPAYNQTAAFINAGVYDPTQGTGSNGDSHGGTQADWLALKASLVGLKSLGLNCEVVLWHEIEHQGLSGIQYWSMLAYYSSAVVAALGTGHLHHVSSAAYHGKMLSLFPGKPNFSSTCFVDKVWIDCYTHTWLGGFRFDGLDQPGVGTVDPNSLIGLAQRNGKPFGGVMEMGMGQGVAPGQVPADTPRYIDYLTLCAAAYPGSSYAWYADPTGPDAGTNDVMPGYASGLNGGYDARPNLRNLCDTILGAGGGGGTPEIEGTTRTDGRWMVTLKVTDSATPTPATATATVTFIIDPIPQPPPPPPPPVPSPRPKAWRFIAAAPQPDGTWLGEIGQAQQRTVTFRNGAGQYHEAAVDINGYDPVASSITELQTDLQVVLDGQVLFCGRFGAVQDTLDATQYRFAPTALDYREVLRRRSLAHGGGPNFQNADVADIAWGLLKTGTNTSGQTGVQGYPGGGLGIGRGLGQDGLGINRTWNYIRQSFAGIEIDNLAQMDPGGFDWDITPYGPADLRLDMWAPNRGTDHGVVLEYGGGLVSSITRNTDPSTYADDIFVTPPSVSGSTTVESGSNGGTISDIAHWSHPSAGVLDVADATPMQPSGVISVHASGGTNAILTYTGRAGPSLTGCAYVSGSASGTVSTGNQVTQIPLTPVQLDASAIGSRIEGRWSQVTAAPTTITTQDALNDYAAFALADAEVILPSYTVTLRPGVWEGPGHIWIGDTITVRIKAGRLAVNDQLRVQELAFVVSPDNVEVLTLTIGRLPFRLNQRVPQILRRLRSLETQ